MRYLAWFVVAGLAAATLRIEFAHAHASQAQNGLPQNLAGPQAVSAVTMMASAVPCTDLNRSIAFYVHGLGMTLGGRTEMATMTEVPLILPGGGAYLLLVKPKRNEISVAARTILNRVVLAVPDIEALAAQLASAGYHFDQPVHRNQQYHVAVALIHDPDGNQIELVQRTHA